MKISFNWLRQYIETGITPEEISSILTNIGLEVESIEKHESIKGGLEKFVIGKVLECSKHPNADKLSVTKVDVGNAEPLNIVCGASNVAAGQKVVVAAEGAVIYKGDDCFEIKKTKLRGIDSEGMICAEDELGTGYSHDGIMVLGDDPEPGTPARDYFEVESDHIFEIGLIPNHIDAASHFGVARDLAAFLSVNNTEHILRKPSVNNFAADNNTFPFSVSIENTESCLRYAGVTMTGITVAESPKWLQKRLKAIGLNPINNIVDITNFVLHETGQPLHAFDADKLSGKKIIVRNVSEGTKFTTLDGVEHSMKGDDLLICDQDKPVAIAGVFGGMESGITENTKNIFLESAYFNPASIRRTSKHHGLSTDSSFRFERGADPNNTVYALKRTALLIKEIAGGSISSNIYDMYPAPVEDTSITVSLSSMAKLIGKTIDSTLIKKILEALEIKVSVRNEDSLTLLVPPYRVDVKKEADIVEEILRIYGYNNVEPSEHIRSSIPAITKPDMERIVDSVSDMLAGKGFNEIMCNSLTKGEYYESNNSFPDEKCVKIINPLSNDLNVMRQTLLYGMLETVIHNINRQNPNVRIFEKGFVYSLNTGSNGEVTDKYNETLQLGLCVSGLKLTQHWARKEEPFSFFSLKAVFENVLSHLGINIDKCGTSIEENNIFSQSLQYTYNNANVGTCGIVSSTLLGSFDIKNAVYFANINISVLPDLIKNHQSLYTEIPRFPEVRRDIALLIDSSVSFEEIKKIVLETEKELVKDIRLFDIYKDDKIGKDKKSYAISVIMQDSSKTLTDKEIDKATGNIQSALIKELKAEIR